MEGGGVGRSQAGRAAELRNNGNNWKSSDRNELNRIVHANDKAGKYVGNNSYQGSADYSKKADAAMNRMERKR
jgi:hypothetical protein